MRPFVDALMTALPRSRFWIVMAAGDLDAARHALPDCHFLEAPADDPDEVRRAFGTVRPRSVAFIGERSELPNWLVSLAESRNLPVVVAEPRGTGPATPAEPDFPRYVSVDIEDIDRGVTEVAGAFTRYHRQRDFHDRGPRFRLRTRILRLAILQPLAKLRSRRIKTLEELRDRLGGPDTILCLGSGPSSEDPALAELDFDRLFRVNLRWFGRGFLDQPDVIFTFRTDVYRAKLGAILGIRTVRLEQMMLGCRRPRDVLGPVLEYFTLQRLPLLLNRWPIAFRPSTGTAMIEVAAALGPKRLIIGGFDLYMHPDGAYPGDAKTANTFDLMHDRETEIACIVRVLEGFQGEVVVGGLLHDRLASEGIKVRPLSSARFDIDGQASAHRRTSGAGHRPD